MFKSYPNVSQIKELKSEPKNQTLNAILNYSRSLEVKRLNGKKTLIHQN